MPAVVLTITDAVRKPSPKAGDGHLYLRRLEGTIAELRAQIAELDAQLAEVAYDRNCWRAASQGWQRSHKFEIEQGKRLAERAAVGHVGPRETVEELGR